MYKTELGTLYSVSTNGSRGVEKCSVRSKVFGIRPVMYYTFDRFYPHANSKLKMPSSLGPRAGQYYLGGI